MQEFYKSGRYLIALAVLAFGIIQLFAGTFMTGFLPIPESPRPVGRILFYLISLLLIVAGGSMFFRKTIKGSQLAIALFALFAVYPHLFQLMHDLHNPGPWTALAETLGFLAGCILIFGLFGSGRVAGPSKNLFLTARVLVAIGLLVVAVQHFLYAEYIATLIPEWIPFRLFWTYFVGAAFALTAISLLTGIRIPLSSVLLGYMFLFWVFFLHAPRVALNAGKEAEWTSLFVALGFAGTFFLLANAAGKNVRNA